MVLHVTERGEALVRGLLPRLYGPLRDMFADFSAEDQQRLIEQLKLLGARLDQALSPHRTEPAE
jgi:DNA-binding MarR family transcriptional regulator